jgi:hypothetical protein
MLNHSHIHFVHNVRFSALKGTGVMANNDGLFCHVNDIILDINWDYFLRKVSDQLIQVIV